MKIDHTISYEDVANESTFWQCKVYADARGGSRDLCKFSLDLTCACAHLSSYGMPNSCRNHVAFVDNS